MMSLGEIIFDVVVFLLAAYIGWLARDLFRFWKTRRRDRAWKRARRFLPSDTTKD